MDVPSFQSRHKKSAPEIKSMRHHEDNYAWVLDTQTDRGKTEWRQYFKKYWLKIFQTRWKTQVSGFKRMEGLSERWKNMQTGQFCKTFKVELTSILLKLFQRNGRERNPFEPFLQSQHRPDTKTRQKYHRKENWGPTSLTTQTQKSSTTYQQTKFNNILKGSYTMIKWDLSQGCKKFRYVQINQCDTPHQQIKEWKPYDHLNRCRKGFFDKIQYFW